MNKPLSFSLFRNDKKTGNQPDYRTPVKGVLTITEPGEYKVAGWKKETKEGQPYLSCVLERVDPGAPSRAQNVAQIQAVRQALDAGQAPPQPFRSAPPPQGQYRPTQARVQPNADDLPF
jgi:uncharacterized protein (DUF736 family)